MESVSKKIEEHIPGMHGWCTIEKAQKIAQIIVDNNLKVGAELGVFGGRSLIAFGFAFKETGGKITGIDPWEASASLEGKNDEANDEWWAKIDYNFFFNYTLHRIVETELESVIDIMRMKSDQAVHNFGDNSLDFIHQDSNHSEEISCDEVHRWYSKLRTGGYWIADDTNWATTAKAQRLLLEKGFKEIYCAPNSEWKIYIKQ